MATQADCTKFRKLLKEQINPMLEAAGLGKADVGNIRFNSREMRFKMFIAPGVTVEPVKIPLPAGVTQADADKEQFERLATRYGFLPSDYRGRFKHSARVEPVYLIGFRIGAKKNNCRIETVEGATYSCSPSALRKVV